MQLGEFVPFPVAKPPLLHLQIGQVFVITRNVFDDSFPLCQHEG